MNLFRRRPYDAPMYADYDPAAYPKYMMRWDSAPWGGKVIYIRADRPNHLIAINMDGSVCWENTGAGYNFDQWIEYGSGTRMQVSPLYVLRVQHDLLTEGK